MEEYKDRFIKYFIDSGFERFVAEQELEAWLENMDVEDLYFEEPEYDAAECISYWDGD